MHAIRISISGGYWYRRGPYHTRDEAQAALDALYAREDRPLLGCSAHIETISRATAGKLWVEAAARAAHQAGQAVAG